MVLVVMPKDVDGNFGGVAVTRGPNLEHARGSAADNQELAPEDRRGRAQRLLIAPLLVLRHTIPLAPGLIGNSPAP